MFQSLLNFAESRDLTPLRKNTEKKRLRARIVLEDGKWTRTDDEETKVAECPSVGSLKNSRPSPICEKAGIVLYGAKNADGSPLDEKYEVRHSMFLEMTRDGAKESETMKQILTFLEEAEANPDLKQAVYESVEDLTGDESSVISFKVNGRNAEATTDWIEWFDEWMEGVKSGKKPEKVGKVESAVSGKIVVPMTEKFPMVRCLKSTPIASFDKDSFRSYGFDGSMNLPMSDEEARKITAALDFLFESDANRDKNFGIVYWFDSESDEAERSLRGYFRPSTSNEESEEDDEFAEVEFDAVDEKDAERKYSSALRSFVGKGEKASSSEKENAFHVMRYSTSEARMYLADERTESYGTLFEALKKWERDTAISEPQYKKVDEKTTVVGYSDVGIPHAVAILNDLLDNKEAKVKMKQAEKEYGSSRTKLFETICFGDEMPKKFYDRALRRIATTIAEGEAQDPKKRAEQRRTFKTAIRVVKTYLIRNGGMKMLDSRLCEDVTNKAYLLGRWLAVVEKMQRDASDGEPNKTIASKLYKALAVRPRDTFGRLTESAFAYGEKLRNKGRKDAEVYYVNLMSEIAEKLGDGLPTTISNDDRGSMALGYHQQRGELYRKKEKPEASSDATDDNGIEKKEEN